MSCQGLGDREVKLLWAVGRRDPLSILTVMVHEVLIVILVVASWICRVHRYFLGLVP